MIDHYTYDEESDPAQVALDLSVLQAVSSLVAATVNNIELIVAPFTLTKAVRTDIDSIVEQLAALHSDELEPALKVAVEAMDNLTEPHPVALARELSPRVL